MNVSKDIINYFWKDIEKDMYTSSIDIKSPSRLLETIINRNIDLTSGVFVIPVSLAQVFEHLPWPGHSPV